MYVIVWFIVRGREKREITTTGTVYHIEEADDEKVPLISHHNNER